MQMKSKTTTPNTKTTLCSQSTLGNESLYTTASYRQLPPSSLQGFSFRSAGTFLPTITASDAPARLQWACGRLVLHVLPVGDTELGPAQEQGRQWAKAAGRLRELPRAPPAALRKPTAAKKPDGAGDCIGATDTEPEAVWEESVARTCCPVAPRSGSWSGSRGPG